MEKNSKICILTGPESVGKSTLSKQLAEHFSTIAIPEYARTYAEKLNREFTFDDVVLIAKKQIEQENAALKHVKDLLILDTDLIITKVWFDVVFGKIPDFVDEFLRNTENRFHLLLDTSIEWKADTVRENGGEQREILFQRYKDELEYYNLSYEVISGKGNERIKNAINFISMNL